jgi:hypothetical protein
MREAAHTLLAQKPVTRESDNENDLLQHVTGANRLLSLGPPNYPI